MAKNRPQWTESPASVQDPPHERRSFCRLSQNQAWRSASRLPTGVSRARAPVEQAFAGLAAGWPYAQVGRVR